MHDAPKEPAEVTLGAQPTVPRIALTKEEAAKALGMSVRSLDKYVVPDVKMIRRGKIVLIPTRELDAWANRVADYTT
jgi:hypothetical protein